MASAMLLPIWMVLDLRRILSDYDIGKCPPTEGITRGERVCFDGKGVVKFESQLASAMLLPIWMVLDLRRILSDYDMVSAPPYRGKNWG